MGDRRFCGGRPGTVRDSTGAEQPASKSTKNCAQWTYPDPTQKRASTRCASLRTISKPSFCAASVRHYLPQQAPATRFVNLHDDDPDGLSGSIGSLVPLRIFLEHGIHHSANAAEWLFAVTSSRRRRRFLHCNQSLLITRFHQLERASPFFEVKRFGQSMRCSQTSHCRTWGVNVSPAGIRSSGGPQRSCLIFSAEFLS